MVKIQFGSSDPIVALYYSATDSLELFITFDCSVVSYDTLDKALASYGGAVKVTDENGEVLSDMKGYDSEPSIMRRYEDGKAIFQVNLKRVSTADLESVKTSIASVDAKADALQTTVNTNTTDIASALESVASLFEMVTASETTDTTDGLASTSTDSTATSESTDSATTA